MDGTGGRMGKYIAKRVAFGVLTIFVVVMTIDLINDYIPQTSSLPKPSSSFWRSTGWTVLWASSTWTTCLPFSMGTWEPPS